MTPYWPPLGIGIEVAPDSPVLQVIAQALQPLDPFLRTVRYDSHHEGESAVTVVFGTEAHQVYVRVHGDDLLLDLPIGMIPHTEAAMLTLLRLNGGRRWPFRVDGSGAGGTVMPDQPMVVAVIEHRAFASTLSDLPQLILEGWREKTLIQATVYDLRGEFDV